MKTQKAAMVIVDIHIVTCVLIIAYNQFHEYWHIHLIYMKTLKV